MKKLFTNFVRVSALLGFAYSPRATASVSHVIATAAQTTQNAVVVPAHAAIVASEFVLGNPMNLAVNCAAYAFECIWFGSENKSMVAEYRRRDCPTYQIYEKETDTSQQPGVGIATNIAGVAAYYGIEHLIGSARDYSSVPVQYLIAAAPIIMDIATRIYARKWYNTLPMRTALKPFVAAKRFLRKPYGASTASLAAALALYIVHAQQQAIPVASA